MRAVPQWHPHGPTWFPHCPTVASTWSHVHSTRSHGGIYMVPQWGPHGPPLASTRSHGGHHPRQERIEGVSRGKGLQGLREKEGSRWIGGAHPPGEEAENTKPCILDVSYVWRQQCSTQVLTESPKRARRLRCPFLPRANRTFSRVPGLMNCDTACHMAEKKRGASHIQTSFKRSG